MRVDQALVRSAPAREVEPKLTAVSRDDLRAAIGRAHQRVTGRSASPATLDILTAHASLETASGARMFNFNFGGIKGASPTGETARCKTHEIIDGKDVTIRDGFRAYRSLDDGAVDYVKLMHARFPGAVAEAERGNVDGFAHSLKASRYYTADEGAYAAALRGLSGIAHDPSAATPSSRLHLGAEAPSISAIVDGHSPAEAFVGDSGFGRMIDSIGHHPAREERDDDDE